MNWDGLGDSNFPGGGGGGYSPVWAIQGRAAG